MRVAVFAAAAAAAALPGCEAFAGMPVAGGLQLRSARAARRIGSPRRARAPPPHARCAGGGAARGRARARTRRVGSHQ